MGFHHVALATNDTAATHAFYTDVMGFELVKVAAGPTPGDGGGYTKHFFYATNTGADDHKELIAFWEINDPEIGDDFGVDLNASAGLPGWVNHIAFDAPTRDDLDRHRARWQSHGHAVVEIDHGFCTSIYITDPMNNMVEFCHTTELFTAKDRVDALVRLTQARPEFDRDPKVVIHQPTIPA